MQATYPRTSYQDQRWPVPSSTTPGLTYLVSVDPLTLLFRCTCPDHEFRHRDCKHIRSVQAHHGIGQPLWKPAA